MDVADVVAVKLELLLEMERRVKGAEGARERGQRSRDCCAGIWECSREQAGRRKRALRPSSKKPRYPNGMPGRGQGREGADLCEDAGQGVIHRGRKLQPPPESSRAPHAALALEAGARSARWGPELAVLELEKAGPTGQPSLATRALTVPSCPWRTGDRGDAVAAVESEHNLTDDVVQARAETACERGTQREGPSRVTIGTAAPHGSAQAAGEPDRRDKRAVVTRRRQAAQRRRPAGEGRPQQAWRTFVLQGGRWRQGAEGRRQACAPQVTMAALTVAGSKWSMLRGPARTHLR